jgi:hypothetical protein
VSQINSPKSDRQIATNWKENVSSRFLHGLSWRTETSKFICAFDFFVVVHLCHSCLVISERKRLEFPIAVLGKPVKNAINLEMVRRDLFGLAERRPFIFHVYWWGSIYRSRSGGLNGTRKNTASAKIDWC